MGFPLVHVAQLAPPNLKGFENIQLVTAVNVLSEKLKRSVKQWKWMEELGTKEQSCYSEIQAVTYSYATGLYKATG